MTSQMIHGSCLCGNVAYALNGSINQFTQCHCSRCRKVTGSAFASNLLVDAVSLHWVRGENDVVRFEPPEADRFATVFCKACGAPLPHRSRDGATYYVPAGSLDDDPGIQPQQIIYWASRAPWYVYTDTLEVSDADL